GPANEDTLSRREPIDLDDTGGPRHREACRRRHAGRGHDVLGETLRPLDPRRGGTWPEDGDAGVPKLVGHARDERRLRPDDHEVELVLATEREQALPVLSPDGMTVADLRDSGVSGRGMQLAAVLALRQFPGKRVLAPARPHHQNLHASSVSKGSYARILLPWSNPASIGMTGRRSGKVSSPWWSTLLRRPSRRWIG